MIDPEEQRKRLLAIQDSLNDRTEFPVLIVDDDDQDLFLTQQRLQSVGGVKATTVSSGGVAAEMIKQGGFAMIFLDWKLIGKSGLATLKLIKDKCPACIVIILSGVATDEDLSLAVHNGAAAVMAKPITDEQIRLLFHSPLT